MGFCPLRRSGQTWFRGGVALGCWIQGHWLQQLGLRMVGSFPSEGRSWICMRISKWPGEKGVEHLLRKNFWQNAVVPIRRSLIRSIGTFRLLRIWNVVASDGFPASHEHSTDEATEYKHRFVSQMINTQKVNTREYNDSITASWAGTGRPSKLSRDGK